MNRPATSRAVPVLALLAALATAPVVVAVPAEDAPPAAAGSLHADPPEDDPRPTVSSDASLDDLRRQIEALRAEIESVRTAGSGSGATSVSELERRIDLLAGEIESLRTAGASGGEQGLEPVRGLAPAASKVYGVSRGVSLGGYGEVLFEDFGSSRQDGAASDTSARIDFLRQILYVGYKFSDRILFNSEIEFEHAKAGEGAGGEVAVEFGYLELQPSKHVGLRAGMLLMPVGFLNELHEPPIFHGARRPDVESAVIPSTWRENGFGLFGEAGPVSWRAYAVAGLDSAGFGARGIRGGRQEGSESLARDWGMVGRLDYTGLTGLLVGASVFSGNSGQGARAEGRPFGARLSLFEAHVQYQHRGLELRALAARSSLGDAALVNAANGLSGVASVGEAQWGWYVQAAFDVMTLSPHGRWSVSPFVRYERLDTQDGVPAGFVEDPATDREVLTFGVGVKPLPQVVLKTDYAVHRNEARTGTNRFHVAVGYLF